MPGKLGRCNGWLAGWMIGVSSSILGRDWEFFSSPQRPDRSPNYDVEVGSVWRYASVPVHLHDVVLGWTQGV